ncbi:hypothetical protein [Terasakiella sp.]|uniref:hypothetical protein n=1 Tax=Terasakiella sp. TaxID=2034861 RepID=UPI003AA90950
MTEIHISEIVKQFKPKGIDDDFFLEISFADPKGTKSGIIDHQYKNAVITTDCPYGGVTILFDDEGQLKSIEIC